MDETKVAHVANVRLLVTRQKAAHRPSAFLLGFISFEERVGSFAQRTTTGIRIGTAGILLVVK